MKAMGGNNRMAGALAALAGMTFLGSTLVTVPAATAAETCPVGVPGSFDFNGDGSADLAAFVNGSQPFGLPDRIQSADLNGDACADIVELVDNSTVAWTLGSPDGLDTASRQVIEVQGEEGSAFIESVAAMRQGDKSQIIAATMCSQDAGCSDPYLDVVTLDAEGGLASRHRIGTGAPDGDDLADVSADDGVVVVGYGESNQALVFTSDGTAPSGLAYRTKITQDSPGVPGSSEDGDYFGLSVAVRDGYLAVGVPGETTSGVKRTGRVQLFKWDATAKSFTPGRSLSQNTKGIVGTNEKDDQFGSAVAIGRGLTGANSYDVIVGTPYENVGSVVDAGSVTVANFSKAVYRTYTQSTSKVPGKVKKSARFGYKVGFVSSKTDSAGSLAAWSAAGCAVDSYLPTVAYTSAGRLTSTTGWNSLAGACSPPS